MGRLQLEAFCQFENNRANPQNSHFRHQMRCLRHYGMNEKQRVKFTYGGFDYPALTTKESIRLLELELAGPPISTDCEGIETPIRCSLVAIQLDENPIYEALSYSWQDDFTPDRVRWIICNNAWISVHESLFRALGELYKLNRGLLLWVDSICINQADTTERNEQVRMMRDIYGSAKSVIVWLGSSKPATTAALNFIEQAVDSRNRDEGRQELSIHDSATKDFYSAATILEHIFQRKWFWRTWVIQEVVVAKHVTFFVGPYQLSAEMVRNTLVWIIDVLSSSVHSAHDTGIDFMMDRAKSSLRVFQLRDEYQRGVLWAMEECLSFARGRGVTDPRDSVFALLGLAHPCTLQIGAHLGPCGDDLALKRMENRRLTPDYAKTSRGVFLECTRALLHQGLQVLPLNGQFPSATSDFPSWIPAYHLPLRPKPFRSLMKDFMFRAAKSSLPNFWISSSGSELHISAMNFDIISLTGEGHGYTSGIGLDSADSIGEFLDILSAIGPTTQPIGAHSTEIVWRTLTANLWCGKYPAPDMTIGFLVWIAWLISSATYKRSGSRGDIKDALDRFLKLHDGPSFPIRELLAERPERHQNLSSWTEHWSSKLAQLSGHRKQTEMFLQAITSACSYRRLFMTRSGYLGIGPWSLQKGDSVMIVAGAYVPYIVRQTGGSSESYELIGEAYVHGIMNGEAMEESSLSFNHICLV